MTTLLTALAQTLYQAGAYHQGEVSPPACILWPDPEGLWAEAVRQFGQTRPVLTLGQYDQGARCGPAIWIRTALLDVGEGEGLPPVVYLPGVRRSQLRGHDPAVPLQPLVELQYRGVTFAHPNGKSWTPAAFLQNSTHGLGIEVMPEAHAEVRRQLPLLLGLDVQTIRQQAPVSSRWLRALAYPDLGGALLGWLNTAEPAAADETFQAAVGEIYGVSLSEGPLTVTTRLSTRQGSWAALWARFEESPASFPWITMRLEQVGPNERSEGWTVQAAAIFPQVNAAAEQALQRALEALLGLNQAEVRIRIQALEAEHAVRRGQVWTRLGRSPLAAALEHLSRLADLTAGTVAGYTVSGQTVQDLAAAYAGGGFEVDLALIDTLASAKTDAALQLLGKIAAPLYRMWLEGVNQMFGSLALQGLPRPRSADWPAEPGLAVLFVDGLRFDLASRLAELFSAAGVTATLDWQFSALPSITPTAKPAVAPQGGALEALSGEKLSLAHLGRISTAQVLRQVLAQRGFTYLEAGVVGDPATAAWAETGDIDRLGHSEGVGMPRLLGGLLTSIQERVQGLLAAGYREVRIITDHGWLLLPGGLPKVELPAHLTQFRKGRCAVLKGDNNSAFPSAPWTWDAAVKVTLAPGLHAFEAGQTYEHGGATLQECVIPILTVRASAATVQLAVRSVRWTNMRCRVELTGDALQTYAVDLRRKTSDPGSSLLDATKTPDAKGQVSLLVRDDEAYGEPAMLVVLDGDRIVRQQAVIVGGEA